MFLRHIIYKAQKKNKNPVTKGMSENEKKLKCKNEAS
jgi:hypothetical protein